MPKLLGPLVAVIFDVTINKDRELAFSILRINYGAVRRQDYKCHSLSHLVLNLNEYDQYNLFFPKI